MSRVFVCPWVWGLALMLLGVLTLIATAKVTIEVDDGGRVTVTDPDQRVTVRSTAGDGPAAPPPTSEPSEPDPTPSAGPVSFAPGFPDLWDVSLEPDQEQALSIATPQSWPDDADLLVLAWSEDRRAMVDGFVVRFHASPVQLPVGVMAGLPAGRVELQALWRRDGQVVAMARHALVVEGADRDASSDPGQDAGGADLGPQRDDDGFTDWPLHPEARAIHVASAGDDRSHGLDADHPVRTLARAKQLVRNGYGDHLLLRASDTFHGGFGHWTRSGRDRQFPLVVGVYGQGDRPTILTDGGGLLHTTAGSRVDFLAIQGLRVVAARRDPDRADFRPNQVPYREKGIGWYANGTFLHLEDCVFDRFGLHLVLQNGRDNMLRDVVLRRSIFTDAWSHWDGDRGGHSAGIYAQRVNGLTVDECVFDHNGWADDADGGLRTKFNHNLYIQHDCKNVSVTDSVIARGASYGLQLRPGGRATGNLFARNALGMYLALAPSVVAHNVVTESDNMTDKPDGRRGYGIETWPVEHALIEHNLLLTKTGDASWAGAIEITEFGSWSEPVNGYRVTVRHNTVVGWPREHGKRSIVVRDRNADVSDEQNVLDAVSGGERDPRFVDAAMTLDRAADGNFEAWLDRSRRRPRRTWETGLTAQHINDQLFAAYRLRSR